MSPPSAYKTRLHTSMFRVLLTNSSGLQQIHGRVSFIAAVTKTSMWLTLWNGPSLFRFRQQNPSVRLRKTSWFGLKHVGFLMLCCITLWDRLYMPSDVRMWMFWFYADHKRRPPLSHISVWPIHHPQLHPSLVVLFIQHLISLWWCLPLLPYKQYLTKTMDNQLPKCWIRSSPSRTSSQSPSGFF